MALLFYFSCLISTIIVWNLRGLYLNWKIAADQGLPIILSPAGTPSPFWILLHRVLPPVLTILAWLPFGLGKWAKYTYIGWTFEDKYKIHEQLGPAFVICTPWMIELVIADQEATKYVLNNRKAFIKPQLFYDALNLFGRNVDTVEGTEWQKHRRITAPSLNERVSTTVWKETLNQAQQMRDEWLAQGDSGTQDVIDDTATLALHVLTSAGFGISYSFKDASQQIPPSHKQSYRDALVIVLQNWTLLGIIPMRHLTKTWLPASLQKVGNACIEFKSYMREMVLEEKENMQAGTNLLSTMVRASEKAAESGKDDGFTDEELYGNIFIHSMAGHETTANTLGTAIAYLAADPQWQDWIREELDATLQNKTADAWDYKETFPKLIRCLAVMYETLRLHASGPFIPKESSSPQTISIAGKPFTIPAKTFIVINMQAIHTNPHYWGPDALSFRPDRWITHGSHNSSINSSSNNGAETLLTPPEGQYLPWASGPRSCPSKKFSQVEFVAAIASLLQNCAVEAKPRAEAGESMEQARNRLMRTIDDSGIHGLTLQISRPKDVDLVWRRL